MSTPQAVKDRAELDSQLAADRADRAQQIEAITAAQARSQAELAALEADAAHAKASASDQVQPVSSLHRKHLLSSCQFMAVASCRNALE